MLAVTKRLQSARSITHFDPGLLLAGLLALFVVVPLAGDGLPGSADTPIHFYRALEFTRSWGPGVIYPRWAPDLAYGYGYPLWNFAPPLPYLIPLFFYAAGLSLETSLKLLITLAALGYALGTYLFVRDRLGPQSALVAAAIYTLAPFALREALLYGGNYPQYLAISLYPWLLWALGRVHSRRGGPGNILLIAFFYGALILSHLFHALALTPVAAAYAVLLWLGDLRDLRRPAASGLGLGLGLLITTFFWLPALMERSFTRAVEDIYLSVSPVYLRFLDWRELLAWPRALDARAANPWVPFSLGPAALALAVLGTLAYIIGRRLRNSARQGGPIPQDPERVGPIYQSTNLPIYHALFFLVLLAACIFMMLPASSWVWADAPFLAVAEFPWRLLGLVNLCLAFLGAAGIHRAVFRWRGLLALGGALLVLFSSAVYLYPPHPFVRYGETVGDMAGYELVTQTIGTTTLGEYLPRWVIAVPQGSPMADALRQGRPVDKLDPASLPERASVHLLNHTAVSDVYRIDSPAAFQARFRTFYFPGWAAYVDGQAVDIVIEPESGLITASVPAGSHELRLSFQDTPLRTMSNVISGLALVGLLATGLRRAIHPLRDRPEALSLAFPSGEAPLARAAPSPQPPATSAVWPRRLALIVGGVLIGILACKEFLVDPHTGWFRTESPPGQVNRVQHPMQVDLDGRFWLLGYDLDQVSVAQGKLLRVVLYWQAQRPIDINYRSFVHLDAPTDQRTWAGSDNYHPGDVTAQVELPTSTWDTRRYVRDEHVVRIPPHVPPAAFILRAGLYDPDTGQRVTVTGDSNSSEPGDTITLQTVHITPGRGLRPDEVPNQVAYRLGKSIHLFGYAWDAAGATLTLYWGAGENIEDASSEGMVNYVVFVHILDRHGSLAWGADGPPLGGLYPTSAWRPGEIIADPRSLSLADLPPGAYTLAVGLYDPGTLVRLPVTNAGGEPVPGDLIPLLQVNQP